MPHFLKDLTINSSGILSYASLTHLTPTSSSKLHLQWILGHQLSTIVVVISECGSWSLFIDISSGYSTDVHPPGMTAWLVLLSFNFTDSQHCDLNISHTRRLFGFINAPPHFIHTSCSHSFVCCSSKQSFGLTVTKTPGGIFFFGIVFLLKRTIGWTFFSICLMC